MSRESNHTSPFGIDQGAVDDMIRKVSSDTAIRILKDEVAKRDVVIERYEDFIQDTGAYWHIVCMDRHLEKKNGKWQLTDSYWEDDEEDEC